jgi:hypothetical protein
MCSPKRNVMRELRNERASLSVFNFCALPARAHTPAQLESSFEHKMAAMELRVGGKYRLGRKIGSGSFGDIYLGECGQICSSVAVVIFWCSGQNINTGEEVAIKLEPGVCLRC